MAHDGGRVRRRAGRRELADLVRRRRRVRQRDDLHACGQLDRLVLVVLERHVRVEPELARRVGAEELRQHVLDEPERAGRHDRAQQAVVAGLRRRVRHLDLGGDLHRAHQRERARDLELDELRVGQRAVEDRLDSLALLVRAHHRGARPHDEVEHALGLQLDRRGHRPVGVDRGRRGRVAEVRRWIHRGDAGQRLALGGRDQCALLGLVAGQQRRVVLRGRIEVGPAAARLRHRDDRVVEPVVRDLAEHRIADVGQHRVRLEAAFAQHRGQQDRDVAADTPARRVGLRRLARRVARARADAQAAVADIL